MPLRKIRLELARTPQHPEGSADHGYEFVAPLTADGHFDAEEWRQARDRCTVRRFWRGEAPMDGRLIHRGSRWAFHYDDEDDEEEPIFRFDRHTFNPGDYVSITEHDGELRTFRVASVR
ncbi:hypothetical protein [Azospirillum halopraeferens]|uniref:hypothetical protein n=1 Tax=Azospirillum halopraeferens TaxID=34010 RepID=UPI000417AD49|nr:hypothetical protein [Azospirillum halopraeferens]